MKIARADLLRHFSTPQAVKGSRYKGSRTSIKAADCKSLDYDPRHQILVAQFEGASVLFPLMAISHMEPELGESLPAGPGRPRKVPTGEA